MTNERSLLRELNDALERAWNDRTLPASVISADLVRRVKACLADESHTHAFNDLTPDAPCQISGCGMTRRMLRAAVKP